MERGYLIVNIAGSVFTVVHLHAHNATARELETKLIVKSLDSLVSSPDTPVFIMGDYNTLSPYDDQCYDDEGLISYLFNPAVNVLCCVCCGVESA